MHTHSFPTRRSSDLGDQDAGGLRRGLLVGEATVRVPRDVDAGSGAQLPQLAGCGKVVLDQQAQVVAIGTEAAALAEPAFVLHVDHERGDLVVAERGIARYHRAPALLVHPRRGRVRTLVMLCGPPSTLPPPTVHTVFIVPNHSAH